jgi:hypothetical protein
VPPEVARRFSAVIASDSERANAAIALVLAHPAISSQLVDNLNASTHLHAFSPASFCSTSGSTRRSRGVAAT